MKTNKQIIEKLTDYFMKQPSERVCKALAAMMIDLNRIANYETLDDQKKKTFLFV